MRTLDNCGHIKIGMKRGHGRPEQKGGKCVGYYDQGNVMCACGRCSLHQTEDTGLKRE